MYTDPVPSLQFGHGLSSMFLKFVFELVADIGIL